jgi:hypothetical protein
MTYNETIALVYRVTGAYPTQAKALTKNMMEDMIREWYEALKALPPNGVMEAVTLLIAEQRWMPSLSDIIGKILDVQYGTEDDIIKGLDRAIRNSSNCIIFGQVTDEQRAGYEKLTDFQKLIIHSPAEFNLWLNKDHEWKADRVRSVKRDMQFGRLPQLGTLKALEGGK